MRAVSFLILIISLFICACTVRVSFYIRNTTNESVTIRAHLMNENLATYELPYEDSLISISRNLHKILAKRLKPLKSEKQNLTFELAPHSTFFVGHGPNFNNFTFDEIIIHRGDSAKVILNWDNKEILKVKKRVAWYDIE